MGRGTQEEEEEAVICKSCGHGIFEEQLVQFLRTGYFPKPPMPMILEMAPNTRVKGRSEAEERQILGLYQDES